MIGFEEHAYAHEISTVDPEQKMLFINSRNLTFDSKVSVEERISYAPHPEDPQNKTLMTQQATVIVQVMPAGQGWLGKAGLVRLASLPPA